MKNRKKVIAIEIAVLIVALIVIAVLVVKDRDKSNAPYKVMLKWDFNSGIGDFKEDCYVSDATVFKYNETGGMDDSGCVSLESVRNNDARYVIHIDNCLPDTYYYMSVWTKTQGVNGADGKVGANISVLNVYEYGGGVSGDTSWQLIELYGKTDSSQTSIDVCLRLGFYSADNTGTVWFDDVTVEQLEKLPQGARYVSLSNIFEANATVTENGFIRNQMHEDNVLIGSIIAGFAILILIFVYRYARLRDRQLSSGDSASLINNGVLFDKDHIGYRGLTPKKAVFILIVASLLLRIIFAVNSLQCDIDVGLYKYWAGNAIDKGLTNIYADAKSISLDYPPLFIYFLAFNGYVARILSISSSSFIFTVLVKLPSMLADCVIGYIIYMFASKRNISKNWSLFITAIWLFNPVVVIDSACWGQVDSLLALPLVLAIYFITKEKYTLSAVAIAFAVTLKPQGIILVPILGYALIKQLIQRKSEVPLLKRIMKCLYCLVSFFVTMFLIVLPCGFKMEPDIFTWVYRLYTGTVEGYKGASVNAYNFFFLIGNNWTDDSGAFLGLTYYKWGMISIVVSALISWLLYQKSKKTEPMPFLVSSVLFYLVVTFGPRMHERYFFPVIAFMCIAVLLTNNKVILWLYSAISVINFLVVLEVMSGLKVGETLKNGGEKYEIYGYFYWSYMNPYRRFLALSNVILCVALTVIVVLMVFDVFKLNSSKRLSIWSESFPEYKVESPQTETVKDENSTQEERNDEDEE